jgi:hypothetical protein
MKNSMYVLLLALILLGLTLINVSCAGKTEYVQTPAQVLRVDPANSTSCGNGGVILTVGDVVSALCNGNNGKNGLDAQGIGVVQFCPGTPAYPSTFLEVGLVINNKVYGVYSTNGGFLTYLPPGNYTSNAVGSTCNFTLNADNTVAD